MQGKLSIEALKANVLDIVGKRRSEVLLGGSVSEDCAVLKLEGYTLVSSDPITAATDNLGMLSIDVSVNDIAASGGQPIAAILTIIAPPNTPIEAIRKVMVDAERTAKARNMEIAGGHTEFSEAVNHMITITTVIGRTDCPLQSTSFRAGDKILVTKFVGLEGTGIIASDFSARLKDVLTDSELEQARELGRDISVLAEGLLAAKLVASMHDITEGGLFGACLEVCRAAGLGAQLCADDIPVHPLTAKICAGLQISPYKLLSSGSMLMICTDEKPVLERLAKEGIPCTVVGVVTDTLGVFYTDKCGCHEVTDSEEHLYRV